MAVTKNKGSIENDFRCTCCNESKDKERGYYLSHSILNKATGRMSVCKQCVIDIYNELLEKYGDKKRTIFELCVLLDTCFNQNLFKAALEQSEKQNSNLAQIYMQKANSFGVKNGTGNVFIDSDDYDFGEENSQREDVLKNVYNVSQELIDKWGSKYAPDEIKKLEKFYQDMNDTHDITLPQHKKLLIFMCKLNLKMDKCLEENDFNGFKNLHDQYQKLMQSAGFRPIDKASTDNATGIKTFSQIFEAVEKDGFIKPTSIGENQDIVDRTIMYMLNYIRKLVGIQKLDRPPIDTPKVDKESDVNIDNIEVDLTKEQEEGGDE